MSVYFVQVSSGLVKIGTARNVDKRVSSLQTGIPDELRLIRVIDGGRKTEKWLHRRFAHLRVRHRSEWFVFDEAMMTIVAPDEIPDPPKRIEIYRSTRAYLLACNKLGLLDDDARRTFGIK